jgi:hypothetical protein
MSSLRHKYCQDYLCLLISPAPTPGVGFVSFLEIWSLQMHDINMVEVMLCQFLGSGLNTLGPSTSFLIEYLLLEHSLCDV